MYRLASEHPVRDLDNWLHNVVAGVLDHSDVISVDRAELWMLLDSLPAAILISTDRACTKIVGNVAAGVLLKAPAGRNLSQSAPEADLPSFKVFTDGQLTLPEDLPMQVAARTGRPVARSECEIRFADGSRIFIAGHSIPIRNEVGEVVGSIGAFIEVTARKLELDQARIISRETSHRLKNTVALIQAISRQTLKRQLGRDAYDAYEARLVALAEFQELVYSAEAGEVLLADIVRVAISAIAAGTSGRAFFDGPAVMLGPELALSVSMIIHELATNASKYGALSTESGAVGISWRARASDNGIEIGLEWREHGGPTVTAPERTGFGSRLVKTVAKGLPHGRLDLDFQPEGVRARLAFATGLR